MKKADIEHAIEMLKDKVGDYTFIESVAMMRYYQQKFFAERNDPEKKRSYLTQSRHYEKQTDDHLNKLWPEGKLTAEQTKLFES